MPLVARFEGSNVGVGDDTVASDGVEHGEVGGVRLEPSCQSPNNIPTSPPTRPQDRAGLATAPANYNGELSILRDDTVVSSGSKITTDRRRCKSTPA